jgi:BTB/POZ domain
MSLTLSIGVMAPALDCKPGPPSPTIEHKRPFYFEDSQVVLQASHIITAFYFFNLPSPYIQVDGEIYKIHRYFLTRESQFFSDLFSLSQPGDSASVEGSDNNPIKVPETPTNEFENLLRFFYFGYGTCYQIGQCAND